VGDSCINRLFFKVAEILHWTYFAIKKTNVITLNTTGYLILIR